ncbi:MAG: enoyl-CoA hydratase-related protein, partial [Acidimicrobiales bacterium]|nr:enoyl-CoA hydratase-related protein [Acidimicrobiales bacterium]
MTDAVRVVRIGQPKVRNAINTKTAQRLHDEFVAFDYDDTAKVAVLTGDAAAFCAGANLRDLPKLRDSGPL